MSYSFKPKPTSRTATPLQGVQMSVQSLRQHRRELISLHQCVQLLWTLRLAAALVPLKLDSIQPGLRSGSVSGSGSGSSGTISARVKCAHQQRVDVANQQRQQVLV